MEEIGPFCVPAALLSQNKHLAPIQQEADWAPNLVWMQWQEEKLLPLPEIKPCHSTHSLATIWTELYWPVILLKG
jgi:hypothetical protein